MEQASKLVLQHCGFSKDENERILEESEVNLEEN